MATALSMRDSGWTYEDYYSLDDGRRYEVLDGRLRDVTPAPGTPHQRYSRNLEILLHTRVAAEGLGFVYHAPIDVILDEHDVVQPDILFIQRQRRATIRERGIFGAPDLVVEIVSPSSVHYDYVVKKALYERCGVREYWIVDPAHRSVDVLAWADHGHEGVGLFVARGEVESRMLPRFRPSVEAIFREEV